MNGNYATKTGLVVASIFSAIIGAFGGVFLVESKGPQASEDIKVAHINYRKIIGDTAYMLQEVTGSEDGGAKMERVVEAIRSEVNKLDKEGYLVLDSSSMIKQDQGLNANERVISKIQEALN